MGVDVTRSVDAYFNEELVLVETHAVNAKQCCRC